MEAETFNDQIASLANSFFTIDTKRSGATWDKLEIDISLWNISYLRGS